MPDMGQIPLVTLTTDFGTVDGYVGTMRGVILNIVPSAQLIDISHQITPQNIRQAAYVLYTAYPFFISRTALSVSDSSKPRSFPDIHLSYSAILSFPDQSAD